jgi:hypothetical protein
VHHPPPSPTLHPVTSTGCSRRCSPLNATWCQPAARDNPRCGELQTGNDHLSCCEHITLAVPLTRQCVRVTTDVEWLQTPNCWRVSWLLIKPTIVCLAVFSCLLLLIWGSD